MKSLTIHLLDGPLADRLLNAQPGIVVDGREVALMAYDPATMEPRRVVYFITNSEDGEARFAFWDDERPLTDADRAMLAAIERASDGEVLELLKQLTDQQRKK